MSGPDTSTVRVEALVVVEDPTTNWIDVVDALGQACRLGMAVGVVRAGDATSPSDPPGGFDVGTGELLIASTGRRGWLAVDPTGAWAGQREGDDGSESDVVAWMVAQLWTRGVGPADALVVRARDLPAAVADQQARRAGGALPAVRPAAGWALERQGLDHNRARVDAAVFALADGMVGISGAPLTGDSESDRWALVGNTYVGTDADTRLLTAPSPLFVRDQQATGVALRHVLDLHAGMLLEELETTAGRVRSVRFASLARPGTVVVRYHETGGAASGPLLAPPLLDAVEAEGTDEDGVVWMQVPAADGGVTAAAVETVADGTADRITVYRADAVTVPTPAEAVAGAKSAHELGFDGLLAEHRRAWAERWEDADIVVDGDDDLQQAVRYALFHLMASVPEVGEAAVGARGLTGTSYRGHVFWDADTFTLPFLAATHPASARAMLEYRLRRLPAAMDAARALQREGARFPWESAWSGVDVTPHSARDRTGALVPVRTGQLEDHIVAQVAWAASLYVDWTGDDAFLHAGGDRLLVETARYWASRVRRDGHDAHIYGVIGPDEYHEPVDDNAFTNVMARWNLRRAADAARRHDLVDVPVAEVERWSEIAEALVDNYDADTGLYEQFAGFYDLEPLVISEVAPRRPIAADLLLGRTRVAGAQVVKQADVLMLHHLVPDEVEADSLEPNLRYYEPRTAHGSSLSPGIHASLFARARNYEAAAESIRLASRLDLDDLTGSTAGGLHLATMGGLWQAFAFGFFGLRPRAGRLRVDPRLPPRWGGLGMRVRFAGRRVDLRVEHDWLSITTDGPTPVEVDGHPYDVLDRPLELTRHGHRWEVSR